MDIFSIIILFFVISAVINLIKRLQQPAKKAQNQKMTQEQIEATQRKPAPKPAPRPADFRFPPVQKPAPKPMYQEGRDPDAVVRSDLNHYTPIVPSKDLKNQFSEYEGSLGASESEGEGYKSEAYDEVSDPYRTDLDHKVKVLPDSLTRDVLLQAVVMAEVLKRPGARR